MKPQDITRIAALIAVQALVIILVLLSSYYPSKRAIEQTRGQIRQLSERQAKLHKTLQNCRRLDDDIADLKAAIQKLEDRLPSESRISWLSAQIADLMREHSVDLRSTTDWAQGGTPPPSPQLKRLQKEISTLSTAKDLHDFLESLNSLPFVAVVEDLSVARDQKCGTVSARIKLATFVLPTPSLAALPPPPTTPGSNTP